MKGDMYEYELKMACSPREWRREKRNIQKAEFGLLVKRAPKMILRESYSLSKKNPRISIKKYKGEYSGLELVEVEFDSILESEQFRPLEWMGVEITNSQLGRESWLLDLDREHFLSTLRSEQYKMSEEAFSI